MSSLLNDPKCEMGEIELTLFFSNNISGDFELNNSLP